MFKGKHVLVILSTILVVMLSTTVFVANGLADSPSDELNPVEKKPGYPTVIPPDTMPDKPQNSKALLTK